jgi:hypothetical protein
MNINGYFVKIIFDIFNPYKITVNDPVLLIAIESGFLPQIMPDKYFKNIRSLESKFNIKLSYYSLPTSIGRFLPEKSYTQWIIDSKKLAQDFNNYKNDLISSYDTFEPFIKESNKYLINKVWENIHKDGGSPHENFIIETNKKIINLLPNKEDLYNSINFRILLFKVTDFSSFVLLSGSPKIVSSDKFLSQQIRSDLINIISDAFGKVIRFYQKEKKIRNNMIESFKKEINRIYLLCFYRDIGNVAKQILDMIDNGEYKKDPAVFIDNLSKIKNDLVKEIENCIIL